MLDPAALFGVRATTMFLTAAAATAVVEGMPRVGLPISDGWAGRLTAWAVAVLVTGIAGVALWRSITHAILTGGRIPTGLRAGVWLGLGLAIGELLTFADAGDGWLPPAPYVLLLLVAGSAALLWWAAQCAEVWIRTCRGRSLRWVHLMGLTTMLVVFGAWFDWWYSVGYFYLAGSPTIEALSRIAVDALVGGSSVPYSVPHAFWPAVSVMAQVLTAPMLTVGGLLLWLFPLAAWVRRPVDGMPPWARRALPHADPQAWPGLPPLRRVLGPGAAGGALAVCVTVLVRLWELGHQAPTRPPSSPRS